ncbi:MAG: R3H domain-containing nucleic acid-binding protein [Myxococcota bacterium]|nr:R3H domain-containing nucleic acid-binding protein [Myxococcota bacterium]
MYDAKNERKEFVADGRQEAVAKACDFFGAPESALEIGELGEGAVYGLGGRAVVVAALRDRTPPAPDRGGDRGGDRDRGRSRGGDRDRGRGRGGDRDRGRGRGGDRDRGGRRGPRAAERPEPAAPESTEPSVGAATGDLGAVGQFVCGALERIDLGPFEISETSDDDLVALEIRGAAAAPLVGSDGRAVDALQLLANQVAGRESDTPPRVVLDVEGDSDAREDRLVRLAERVAKRALDSGRSVRLDPMNGRDRRQIHLALRDMDQVVTMSSGEGRYRQVLVVPEGAPEYEEAAREADEAAQRNA